MSESNGNSKPKATVTCPAGHQWESASTGGISRWCPDHKGYAERPISKRNMPPDLEIDRWKSTGTRIGDRGYAKRWVRRWEDIVRMVAARQGTFSALPLDDINEHVRHERLAELHRHYAELDPYPETGSGTAKVHPGWERARIEEVAARQTARRLGLLEALPGALSKGSHPPTRMQEQADELGDLVDDQAGL